MKILISFFGAIKDLVRDSPIKIDAPVDSTTGDLINTLINQYGNNFKNRILTADGRLQNNIHLLKDDQEIDTKNLNIKLNSSGEDTIKISFYYLLPFSGG